MKKYLLMEKKAAVSGDKLFYYLTEEMVIEGEESALSYGVEIRQEKDLKTLLKETVTDICGDRERVELFIKMLCENEVMPVLLFDIVYDKVQEGYFE